MPQSGQDYVTTQSVVTRTDKAKKQISNQSLIKHGIDHLDKTGNIGSGHIITGLTISLAPTV